ncbi:MAG: 2OG-Fe(II) oxygenase [Verrucomicrobiota bacterium]
MLKPELIAQTDALREKAAPILERQVRDRPDDPKAWWNLAENARQRGDLETAQTAAQTAKKLAPELNGPGSPAPHFWVSNFLTPDELEQIWNLATDPKAPFEKSTVSSGKVNRRASLVMYEASIQPAIDLILPKVHQQLPKALDAFHLPRFQISREELQLTWHGDGHFFTPHIDSGGSYASRRITFVYYFHREPKPYSGGDLILADLEGSSFTRLAPYHNRIVFFPSKCWHQVTKVSLESEDWLDGRFTLNGWLHERI